MPNRDVHPTPPPPPPSRSGAAARKGRHGKICTAGGMRDQRMRLSQDVAGRLFALQDMLGFDKASKTVQWLLDMSTTGINHLIGTTTSMSLSGDDGSALLDNNDHIMVADVETNKQQQQQMPKAKRRASAPRKRNNGTLLLLPDKASRVRARQRARERTKERNRLRLEAPAPARQLVVPVLPAACNSYYEEEQEPWDLAGVVFAKQRFH